MPRKKSDSEPIISDEMKNLLDHYNKGREDNDTRRTRKNGWNETINAHMAKLPAKWPYNARIYDPRIRTTIMEKTARLLNAKLQGKLVPREGGDIMRARINNAVLDFQWDRADHGGSMIEKVALADQTARIYGAAFAMVYWDNDKDCNEMKVIDPRDIFIDWAADHVKNAKWVQVREFTTKEALEKRGFDLSKLEITSSDLRSTAYTDIFKTNKGLTDRVGQDLEYTTLEVVTEWTKDKEITFLPRYKEILRTRDNPYLHKRIPIAMLRYYPLGDDIYGESEVEAVLPLQRAINAILCGFIDTMNLAMRPPLKIVSGQVRVETIEYGPGAQWIMDTINATQEAQIGTFAAQQFNNTYPALVAAFNTAMGEQSLGISNVQGYQTNKTATEVASLERQQTSRDQYNQLYLSEFLKDIMLMWLANNKQYLFDDLTKKYRIIKIIGKDNIKNLQQMYLDAMDVPNHVMSTMADTITGPGSVDVGQLNKMMSDLAQPRHRVVLNPSANPDKYQIKPKLEMKNEEEANLYLTEEDLIDVELYDYVPDVKSMAAGAGQQLQNARRQAFDAAVNPQVQASLAQEGKKLKMSEILSTMFQDAGYRDPESIFESVQSAQPSQGFSAPGQQFGLPGLSSAIPGQPAAGPVPNEAQGLQVA